MHQYVPIHKCIWQDLGFRKLSRGARELFLYLLTSPHTTSLPGCYYAPAVTIAYELQRPRRWVLRIFTELADAGMAHFDAETSMVWVPNAPKWNPPANPNVAKAWAKRWSILDSFCRKREILIALWSVISAKRESTRSVFAQVLAQNEHDFQMLREVADELNLPIPPIFNEEGPEPPRAEAQTVSQTVQEPYRNKEKEKERVTVSRSERVSATVQQVVDHWAKYHPNANTQLRSTSKEYKRIVERLHENWTVEQLCLAIDGCHQTPFNLGQNDRERKYLSLGLIMRDSSHVNDFMETALEGQQALPFADPEPEQVTRIGAEHGLPRPTREQRERISQIGENAVREAAERLGQAVESWDGILANAG